MRYKYLSHILTNRVPVFGSRSEMGITHLRSIAKGDSVNMYAFSLQNHWGTHVDLPNHFFDDGNGLDAYPSGFWQFKNPQVVEIKLDPSEVLRAGAWSKKIRRDTDILLFKSNWAKFRNKKIYYDSNPGIDAEVGLLLRRAYPNIRAIGIDWISISPYRNRVLGRLAHRAFLNPVGDNRPLPIIEDMCLSFRLSGLRGLIVAPMRVEKIDSAPCTVIGVFS